MKNNSGNDKSLFKKMTAIALSLFMGTGIMFSQWIPPVIPAAAEEDPAAETEKTDNSEDTVQPDSENSVPADASDDSSQENEGEPSDPSLIQEDEIPSDQPAENEPADVQEDETQPDIQDEETTAEADTDMLKAETDTFTLTLTPDDPSVWQKTLEEYPAIRLVLIPSENTSLNADEGNEVLFNKDYTISFEDNGQPVDLSDQSFTALIQFKNEQLQSLFAAEPIEEAESTSMGVTLKAAGSDKTDPVTKTVELESQEAAPLEFTIKGNESFSLLAEIPNPSFTVQYYVNYRFLTKSATQSDTANNIQIIDSSRYGYGSDKDNNGKGGVLPTNKARPKVVYMDLQTTGTGASATSNFKMTDYMDPFFKEESYTYHKAPNPHYFNKLLFNGNYSLSAIWVLKAGKSPESVNKKDWTQYPANTRFTNNKDYQAEHPDVVLITEGMIMRMVYDETGSTQNIEANFYDYDISNKKNSAGAYVTSSGGSASSTYGKNNWGTAYGINSPENYPNSTYNGRLAFGNVNTGTHLGKLRWTDGQGVVNNLNSYNRINSNNYKGCTFGLAAGMNGEDIQFSNGVTAPKLFNSEPAVGKHEYENSRLVFNRIGDTYTLSAVRINDNGTMRKTATGLENLSHPGNYTSIWTNNFWPMDKTPGVDGLSGKTGNDIPLKGWIWDSGSATSFAGSIKNGTFPPSDDGKAHNPLFGMEYEVDFELTPDYQGPLNYFFFGDDDMWAFLDGKPIVDIGGVHSSVGQYVNLWDYIPHGDSGKHKLNFFYTERGLSGSTCYMQFTLPSVSMAMPSHNTGDLIIKKDTDSTINDPDYEYGFTIRLRDASGNVLPDEYAFTKFNASDEPIENSVILRDGQDFTLKAGEYILCSFLPDGSVYTVEETGPGSATRVETSSGQVFYPQASPDTKPVITGTISKDTTISCYFENSEPKNSIDITKTLTASDSGNTLPSIGADQQKYLFRVLKEDSTLLFPAGTEYTIHSPGQSESQTMTLNEDGIITLSRGQTASFANSYLAENVRYFVQELFEPGTIDAYSSVIVDNVPAKDAGKVTIGTTEYDAWNSAVKDTASADPNNPENTTFDWDNVLDQSKYGSLTIEKQLPDGVVLDNTFTFTVSLNGQPVPDGLAYTIDGERYIFKNSQLSLKAGQKAVIDNLLKGTAYTVNESPVDGFNSQITNGIGTIGLDQNVTVTALNTPQGIDVPIEKIDPSGKEILGQAVFALYSSLPGDGTSEKVTKEFNGKTFYFEQNIAINGTGTVSGLMPGASYVLEEIQSPAGYALLSDPVYLTVGLDKFVNLGQGSDENAAITEDGLGLQIINDEIPGLPNTGFKGTELIVTAGALMLAGSAFIALRKRNRK